MILFCVLNFVIVYNNLSLKGHQSGSLSIDDQDTQDAGCTHLDKLADMMKAEKFNKVIQAGTEMPPPEPAPSTANKWHFSLSLHLLHFNLPLKHVKTLYLTLALPNVTSFQLSHLLLRYFADPTWSERLGSRTPRMTLKSQRNLPSWNAPVGGAKGVVVGKENHLPLLILPLKKVMPWYLLKLHLKLRKFHHPSIPLVRVWRVRKNQGERERRRLLPRNHQWRHLWSSRVLQRKGWRYQHAKKIQKFQKDYINNTCFQNHVYSWIYLSIKTQF